MIRRVNIDNLINSRNFLIINFLKQNEVQKCIKEYKKKPTKYLSDQILSKLEDYFEYVCMLNSLKRNIHFKNKHFYSRNVNKEKLIYVPDEILDINKAKKVYENIKDWEDLIDNDVILKAVKDLDIKSQRILWMLIVNRATQKEVSSVLNISQQSISKEKKRILNKLRRKINYEE
ncbi:hypothetical protein LNA01_22000 [Companilactobacillus nantensis]|uniref:RNA polymerase sigma-70 region 4 domain-containing protein n=2 Tax=Companilactobacillus nantensis TaxID=305793 RepID=A0A0R1W9Y8_9LACO|nr:hypothetical protein FD31_GL001651 [Companilactobacillus nantensis DSM 16982]GEO65017.1 hypothetical protein LNA01_22000 [Companilactobacillus nantensis]